MIVVVGSPHAVLEADGQVRAAGPAVAVARSAARAGAEVQLVGRIGDGPIGDAVALDLARAGIGHAAALRDPARDTPLAPEPGPGAEGDADVGDEVAAGGAIEQVIGDEDVEAAAGEPPAAGGNAPWPGSSTGGLPARLLELDAADVELALRYLREFRVIVAAEAAAPAVAAVLADAAGWSGAAVVLVTRPGDGSPGAAADATVLERPAGDDPAFPEMVGRYAAALDRGEAPGAAFRSATAEVGWERATPD